MTYRIDCTEDDGFMIQSEDEHEAIDVIKEHAAQKHDMQLDDEQAREMMAES